MRQHSSRADRPHYARGTRVDPERSRREIERFLARRGAEDFILVQDNASARLRFALYGNYFELILPLPDPQSRAFSHTPTGRPRTPAGQQRAYEQAIREKWRALVLVTRGKIEAAESGISSLEQEFAVPAAALAPAGEGANGKAVASGPLRRVSRTIVGALGAGLLVPASALSALALPDSAVDGLAGVVWGEQPTLFAQSDPSAATLTVPAAGEGRREVVVAVAADGGRLTLGSATGAAPEAASAPTGGKSSRGGGKGAGSGGGGGSTGGSGGGSSHPAGGNSNSGVAGSHSGGGGTDTSGGSYGGGGGSGGGSDGSGGSQKPPAGESPGNSEWGHQQGENGVGSSSGTGGGKAPKSP